MNPVRADMGLGTAGAHVSRLHPRRERRTSTLVRGMQCQRCAASDPGACCEASGEGEHVDGGGGSHRGGRLGRGGGWRYMGVSV